MCGDVLPTPFQLQTQITALQEAGGKGALSQPGPVGHGYSRPGKLVWVCFFFFKLAQVIQFSQCRFDFFGSQMFCLF